MTLRKKLPSAQSLFAFESAARTLNFTDAGALLNVTQPAISKNIAAVTVQPDGFDYDGQRYKSLSKVANTITGKHWNGFAFFGLGRARKGGA